MKRINKASFVSWAAAAVLLFGSGRLNAQSACLIGHPTTTVNMPAHSTLATKFRIANSSSGQNSPSFYVSTAGGVVRADLTSPGNPALAIQQLASRSPFSGPVPVTPTGDIWQWLSNAAGYEDAGTGRIVTDWPNPYGNCTNCVAGQAQVLKLATGAMAYGQQIDPTGTGAGLGPSPPIQVVKIGGNYYAYLVKSGGSVYVVDVTNPSGSAYNTVIHGTGPVLTWSGLADFQAGTQSSSPYLFGATFTSSGAYKTGTLHIAHIGSDGTPTDLSLPGSATFSGSGGIGVFWQNNKYWIFAIQNNGAPPAQPGIGVFQFDPATGAFTTNPAWFIPAPSGKIYPDIRVRGDVVPIVFALQTNSNGGGASGYDVIGTQYLISGGSPVVSGTIPYTIPLTSNWEVYVKTSAGQTMAYLYVPLSAASAGGEPRIQTSPVDVSCAAVNCSQPPLASLTITNTAGHVGTDSTNYVGDTFRVTDTSASCDPPSLVQWDVDYNGTNFTGDSNPGLPLSSPWQFNTVLPCDPDRAGGVSLIGGENCYDTVAVTSGPATFNWTVANVATNTHGTSTTPGVQTVSLVKPLTKVKNFANGTVQLLSGQPIDASISQGSPASFTWAAPALCATVTTATCSTVANNDYFQVTANYPGGYSGPPVSGTVIVTAVIASFTYPATVLYSSPFSVTNACQVGPSATVTGIGYYIDTNPAGGGNYAAFPSAFITPGHTTQITAPPVAGSYFLHFRVDYTGTPAGPVFFDGPLNVTDVQYNPIVSVSPAYFEGLDLQGNPKYAVNSGVSLSFNDPNDAGNPPLTAVWDFGDGGTTVSSMTNLVVHHTYSVTGTKHATLTVNGITATAEMDISSSQPPPPPPPSGCSVTSISGPTLLQPGTSGTWTALVSGSGCSISWSTSDGVGGSGASFSHAFVAAGTSWVKATAGTSSRTVYVTVGSGGVGLTLSISGPQSISVGTAGTWTANVSGASGTPSVSWVVSDNPLRYFSGTTLAHTFGAPGGYTINCVATDTSGASKSANLNVSAVGALPPSGQFNMTGATLTFNTFNGSYTAAVGDPLTFTAQETDTTVTFSWSFGDGTTATGNPVQHAFTTSGTKQIILTATRAGAPPGTGTQSVNVTGHAFAALVVPGAGYLVKTDTNGNPIGAYATEVSLTNNSANPLTLDFDFEPASGPSVNPATLTYDSAFRQVLQPNQGWYSSDVTNGYLGQPGVGTLFIKYSGSTQPPGITTRIYFSGGPNTPTYGSYLPSYPVNASGQSLGEVGTSMQYLVGIQFGDFHSGLTLVASSPSGGTFNVNLFRDDGTPVGGTMPVTLGGYGQAKLGVATDCGGALGCFTVTDTDANSRTYYVEVTSQNQAAATPVIAYASVIDNRTMDQMLIPDDTPRLPQPPPSSNATLFVPEVGRISGTGSVGWQSDLFLLNPSSQAVPVTFTYLYQADGGAEQQAVALQNVASGQEIALRDIVATLFPTITGNSIIGQLRLDYQPGADNAPLIVEGRNWTPQPDGSYGMQLPAFASTDGVLPGSGEIHIGGLRNDDNSRSTFGFTAMSSGSDPVTVHVDAHSDVDGSLLWSSDYTLNSGGFGHFLQQPTKNQPGLDALQNVSFSVDVTVTAGSGTTPVAAFGAVVDERSNDPIFIPGKRPPQ
jgi:hypothetical protein